jgi:hypothetical protein
MEFTIVLILLAVLSGFVKGFVGFGLSLVLISGLMTIGIPANEFMPILVPLFVILDLLLFLENKKHISLDYKENFTLHPTTLLTLFLGLLLGTYFLTILPIDIIKLSFAILVLIAVFFLLEKVSNHQMSYPSEKANGVFGGITGFLTGLFTLNAIPPSIYMIYHQYPKEKYMGSLVTFLLISDLLLVAVYLFKELFTLEGFLITLNLIFVVLAGFFFGAYLRRIVPTKHFKVFVILVLALNSIKIIFDYFTQF